MRPFFLLRVFPCPNKPDEELIDICVFLPEQGPHDMAGCHEKKRCPKVMKIKVFIFIVKKKKKAEPFISLSWRIKLTDLQRTG